MTFCPPKFFTASVPTDNGVLYSQAIAPRTDCWSLIHKRRIYPLALRPPEEGPHEACFMQWPTSRRGYRDRSFLEWVQQSITRIANTIAAFEPVILLADKTLHSAIGPHFARGE